MYIRRKVFSLLEDVDGEARYFSTTEFELTDGSEERYYSDDEKKGMSKAAKVALGTGAGLAAVAGGIYGGKKLGPKVAELGKKMKYKDMMNALDDEIAGNARSAKAWGRRVENLGEKMQAPGDYVVRVGKAGKAKVVGAIDALKNKVKKDGKKAAKDAAKK